VMIVGEHN